MRGLLPETTAERVAEVFSAAAPIKRLRIVVDREGRSAGVAFVTFVDAEGMRAALSLSSDLEIDGQGVTVSPAHNERSITDRDVQAQPEGQKQGEAAVPSSTARSALHPALPAGATAECKVRVWQAASQQAGHQASPPGELSTDTLFIRPLGCASSLVPDPLALSCHLHSACTFPRHDAIRHRR